MEQNKVPEILLAPLQGFTDAVYRKAYSELFPGIDACFIPYISVNNNEFLKKYKREILPVNNQQKRVIPQVLAKSSDDLTMLTEILVDQGYSEINLNMGCPYPMVTNRGQGAGLLPHPEKIKKILSVFFQKFDVKLSVKMRTGLHSAAEIKRVIPVLNDFNISEIILHPRIASQLYTGTPSIDTFQYATQNSHHKMVYNGDIFSVSDYKQLKELIPKTDSFMLGRGILQNPFLPAAIKNIQLSDSEKREKLAEFHRLIFTYYSEWMDNDGNVLNKMKQFWIYFSHNFDRGEKILKGIKKSRSLSAYKTEVIKVFEHSF